MREATSNHLRAETAALFAAKSSPPRPRLRPGAGGGAAPAQPSRKRTRIYASPYNRTLYLRAYDQPRPAPSISLIASEAPSRKSSRRSET